jgi:hypothetical protein
VRKRTLWISGLTLACGTMAVVAALAAVPPNLGKAIEVQRRLTSERPQDAAVYNDLGNLLVLAGQPDEAEEAYLKAVELAPDKVSALFNLGLLQQQRGERREARRLFQQVLDLQPQHAWAWYQIGALHEQWEQDGRAIEAYAEAFRIDPQLTFPEVNPHIVENKLVTRAMLLAYQEGYAMPQAPAMYDEPGRIVGLLVPRPAQPPAAEPDQTAAEAAPQGGQARPPAPGVATGRPGQPAIIREGDLDRRSTGQASPQGRRGSPGARPSAPMPRGLRTWERPEPTMEEPIYEENPGGDPGQVITPPPGGVYYRPGLQSTGRLNLQLLKDREGRG